MNDSKSLIRQWRLLKFLADARVGYTVKELSTEMAASVETIRRDINDLGVAGFKVRENVGFRGLKRWRVEGFEESFGFSITDMLSIYMGRQFLEPLAGTPFWDGQHKVFSKIRGALGEQAIRYLQKLAGSLHATSVGASDYSKRYAMIDELMVAVEDRLVSLIVYQSDQSTEPVEQEVYPQGFVFHRGSLYLIAWSSRRGEIRTFKMDRIEDVHSTKLPAAIPERFNLSDWLEHSFGVFRSSTGHLQSIRIEFSRDVARYVKESNWHKSQKLTPQKDGSLIAEFQLTDTQEIKRWIMSFGPNARVLGPTEFAEEIAKDLQTMLDSYRREMEARS
ncbi:MAG TPA: WYL domain-containing protein [Planctomycetaceae bacterium]|nr:WYL domain-containing protein [Planctomycetaceae bacterium]